MTRGPEIDNLGGGKMPDMVVPLTKGPHHLSSAGRRFIHARGIHLNRMPHMMEGGVVGEDDQFDPDAYDPAGEYASGMPPMPDGARMPIVLSRKEEMPPYAAVDDVPAISAGPPPMPEGIGMPAHRQAPLNREVGMPPMAAAPAQDKRRSATDQLEALKAPVPDKPKLWQKLAAGALGGLAGYNNANPYARPMDVSGAENAIKYPGYQRRKTEYDSSKDQLQRQVDLERQDEELSRRRDLETAQADSYRKHGQYWEDKGQQEKNRFKIDPKTGAMFDTYTGQTTQLPQSTMDKFNEAKSLGANDNEAREYALQLKHSGGGPAEYKPGHGYADPETGQVTIPVPSPDKPTRLQPVSPGGTLFDPETNKPVYTAPNRERVERDPKPAPPATFGMIETRKQRALADAEDEAQARIRGNPMKGVEPEDPQQVYADLDKKKRQAQNAYESEIAAAGGSVALPSKPRISSGPARGAQAVSRAALSAHARKMGADPAAVIKAAEQRGLKLVP